MSSTPVSSTPDAGPSEAPLVLRHRFGAVLGYTLCFFAYMGTMVAGLICLETAINGKGPFPVEGMARSLVVAGTWVMVVVSPAVVATLVTENMGVVRLEPSGVTVSVGWKHVFFDWSEFLAYRDGSRSSVRLVWRRWRAPIRGIVVPTRTEADRIAVLSYLDRVGLPRAS